jgi:hypothetical protein
MMVMTHVPGLNGLLSKRVQEAHGLRSLTLFLLAATLSMNAAQQTDHAASTFARPEAAEMRKTVEAITGTWEGQLRATVGPDSEVFPWTMDCKVVALGAGAACANGGKASIGLMKESCLLAYDPEGKAVHYMCVTSVGEVHDHKGNWTDDRTIEFEPLQAGLIGKTMTEKLSWSFPDATTIVKTSVVTMSDGSSMKFEFAGKRKGLKSAAINSRK